MRRSLRLFWLPAIFLIAACDYLLTDPIQPTGTIELQFQIVSGQLGTTPQAFAKVEQVYIQLTVPDSVPRDTTISVSPNEGAVRLGVDLRPEEITNTLEIFTRLGSSDGWLFEGQTIAAIEPGVPTDAQIVLAAITSRIEGAPDPLVIPNVGETAQATNAVLYATGDTIPGLDGTWSSLDPAIMTVTPTGLATAVAIGQTDFEVVFETLTDTVTAIVSSIDNGTVTPASSTIFRGDTQSFGVVWRDVRGNVLTNRAEVWSVSDAGVASIDPATGALTTITPGVITVTATAEGVSTSTELTILEPVAEVILTPAATELIEGEFVQLTADLRDVAGNALTGRPVTWASGDVGVATVSGTGLVSAVGTGTVTIVATAEGIEGAATITSIARTPDPDLSTLVLGQTTMVADGTNRTTVTVTAIDAQGPLPGQTVVIAVSGDGNTISQPLGVTNAAGVASGSFTTTTAEAKTVSAVIAGIDVTQTQAVTAVAGSFDGARSSLVVDQVSMLPDGTDVTTVTAVVVDAWDNPLSGQTVVLAVSGTGNTVTQPGLTDGSGVTVGSFTTTAGELKTVSATVGGLGIGQTQAVTSVTSGSVDAGLSSVTVSQSTMIADGRDITTVTVTALDGSGTPLSGETVVLSVSGTGNAIDQDLDGTDASGVGIASFTTTIPEPKTVSVIVGGVLIAETPIVSALNADPQRSSVTVDRALMLSDGADVTTVTVTALNALGDPLPDQTVVLTVSGSGNTVTQPGQTDGAGVAEGSFTTTVGEVKTVSATVGGVAIGQTPEVTSVTSTAVDPGRSSAVVSQMAMIADGIDATSVTVTVLNAQGEPLPGQTVLLSVSGSENTVTQPDLTDGSGVAVGSFTTTLGEVKTVTASVGGVQVGETQSVTSVTSTLVDAGQSSVVVSQTTMIADGNDVTTVTVTALNAQGDPLPGQTVVLAVSGSGNTIVQDADGTDATGVGVASFTTTVPEAKTVSVIVGGVPITAAPILVAAQPDPAQSTVAVNQSTVISNGVDVVFVSVTALDAQGDPVPDLPVVLSVSGTGNTISQPVAVTDASGLATGSFTTTVSEAKTVSATVLGVPLTQTQQVTALDSNPIPIADPGGPYQEEVGNSVLFDGSASTDTAPGVITNYEWIVDGASVFSGASPTFSYACAVEGSFSVELVVTDDGGETSSRSTSVNCQVTRFLGRWVDAAGSPITTASVGQVVELQVCFLENDLTAFQGTVFPTQWGGAAQVDSVADFDNTVAGTHPDCAGTTDVVTEVSAPSNLATTFDFVALSTATGPGVGAQGIASLFFTFLAPVSFDDTLHFGLVRFGIVDTFDGDPPPYVIDIPDLVVN